MVVIKCLGFGFILFLASQPAFARNVVCYYMGGSGIKQLPPEAMDPSLCTHINYAFVNFLSNGTLQFENPNVDIKSQMYSRVVKLKEKNPRLKVLLSTMPIKPEIYSAMANNSEYRRNFVANCLYFIRTYKFDGIDLDWETPTLRDKENFVTLTRELKEKFAPLSWILSIAVMPTPKPGYDALELNKYVDMFNVMTYNFYGPWSKYTGQNSPLYKSPIESNWEQKYLNLAESMQHWVSTGIPKKKFNVGLAFYGRSFTLADPNRHGLHSPIVGKGCPIPAPTYQKICTDFSNYTKVWDSFQQNPYKYKDDQWLGYDDNESIKIKTVYIAEKEFGGAMIWHIGGDDVLGLCGEKQGLLKLINSELNPSNVC